MAGREMGELGLLGPTVSPDYGGSGISNEFGVARHMVNLEVVNTYEAPTTSIRLLSVVPSQALPPSPTTGPA